MHGKKRIALRVFAFATTLLVNATAPSSLGKLFSLPTVRETTTQKSIQILGEAKTFEKNVRVTTWPDGTKQLNFSWSCPQLTGNIKNFRCEASVIIRSEEQGQQASVMPVAYAALPPWPTSQKPLLQKTHLKE